MRVGVFHPGTQHSWQTALAIQEANQLAWYATSVFYRPERFPYRAVRHLPLKGLRNRVERELRRRSFPQLSPRYVRTLDWVEWVEIIARRAGAHGAARVLNEYGNRSLVRKVERLIESEPVDVLWGYNTSSAEVFRWAKAHKIQCVLDQTIGHPASMNAVMAKEFAKNPQFFSVPFIPFSRIEIERQNDEISLADTVVVGSEFCKQSLVENGCPAHKIIIVPYGFDEEAFSSEQVPPQSDPSPVRFLFVGTVEPRKGIAYLLEAFRNVKGAELTVVGAPLVPSKVLEQYPAVKFIPQVSRSEVAQLYQKADCFVFPSLFEGGGIVLYEARAAGLGIIQTSACGDGVLTNGANGCILEPGDMDGLKSAIQDIVDNPSRLKAWRDASWNARADRRWAVYRETVRELLAYGYSR